MKLTLGIIAAIIIIALAGISLSHAQTPVEVGITIVTDYGTPEACRCAMEYDPESDTIIEVCHC